MGIRTPTATLLHFTAGLCPIQVRLWGQATKTNKAQFLKTNVRKYVNQHEVYLYGFETSAHY